MQTSPDIQVEKVETELRNRIGSFHKEDLHHTVTNEKIVLPSGKGTFFFHDFISISLSV